MASSTYEYVVSAGPTIDGIETVLELYEPNQLDAYHYWPQLLFMVNETFKKNHVEFWPENVTEDRFKKSQQFIDELEPDFFTFILMSKNTKTGEAPKIYATASARTMSAHTVSQPAHDSAFGGEIRHIPGKTEAWELKILAVDPSLYRKGVGSMLMDLVELEVKKRVLLKKLASPVVVNPDDAETGSVSSLEIIYTLTTLAEINEQFYLRKGYKRTKLVEIPLGAFGNNKTCHVTHMEKFLVV